MNEYNNRRVTGTGGRSPEDFDRKVGEFEKETLGKESIEIFKIITGILSKQNQEIKDLNELLRKIKSEVKGVKKKKGSFENEIKNKIQKGEEKINKKIKNSEKKISQKIDKSIEKSEDKIDKKIDKSRINIIESLALFAVFFTFAAVNVQVYTKVTNLKSAMWFTVLLMGCLVFFALIIHLIINNKEIASRRNFWILILISGLLIILGLHFGNEKLYVNENNPEKTNIENQNPTT